MRDLSERHYMTTLLRASLFSALIGAFVSATSLPLAAEETDPFKDPRLFSPLAAGAIIAGIATVIVVLASDDTG